MATLRGTLGGAFQAVSVYGEKSKDLGISENLASLLTPDTEFTTFVIGLLTG